MEKQKKSVESAKSAKSVESAEKGKPSALRWLWRLLAGVVILIFAIVLLAVGLLGDIVERVAEKYDTRLIGRELAMDNLRIKLFRGTVAVQNITIMEEDATTEFVRIDNLYAHIKLWDLLDKHVNITDVRATGLSGNLIQGEQSFNFDSLISYILTTYASDDNSDDMPSEWRVTIDNIDISRSALLYHDTTLDQRWALSEVSLTTPSLYLDDRTTEIAAAMNINDTASLSGDLGLAIGTMDFTFDGSVEGFQLGDIYNYLKSTLNISSLVGSTSADVSLKGNILDIMAMDIKGDVAVKGLDVRNAHGGNLLMANSLTASIAELNLNKERYLFNSVRATGYATEFLLNADGSTNFDDLFFGDPEVSVETTTESLGDDMYDVKERVTITTSTDDTPFSNMTLRIAALDLNGGALLFADRTMHKPFEYRLKDISISSEGFDLREKNTVTVRANLQKQGSALIEWAGSLSDFYNQSLLAMLTNVDIKDFSPYVEYFTAFPVSSGNLTFRSQNVVSNGDLSGVNQLGTFNFKVGNKDKSIDAEYNLPLKLGLYILTDSKQHIDIDLPIAGRIDSPEFSYRKIIMKAIGNVLLKVVASPFQWMAPDKQDAFRHIDVNLLETGFNSEHYARLDSMAEALKEDTTLRVRLTQRVNYARAREQLAQLDLKIAYYNSTQSSPDKRLDMLDFARIKDMRLSRSEVSEFADSQLVVRGLNPATMSSTAKAMALYGDMVDRQLEGLMSQRNTIVKDYMAFQHPDIPAEAFTINDVVLDDMKNYTGKDRYTVTLIIDEEEIELIAEEPTATDEQMDYWDAYALEDEGDESTADESEVQSADESTDGTDIATSENLSPTEGEAVQTAESEQ